MPALLYWPFFHWGEGCSLSSSSVEISVSFWVTATWCQSALIWLLRPADYNLISGALKINLCRAFCDRGCVGAGSLITRVYFFVPVKVLLCLNQVPASISHDEAGSDGCVGCRRIKNPQLFSSKLRISQLLNLVPEFCFCLLTLSEEGRVGCGKTKSEVTFMGLFVLGMVHMPLIPGEAKRGGVWVRLIRLCLEQPGFGM